MTDDRIILDVAPVAFSLGSTIEEDPETHTLIGEVQLFILLDDGTTIAGSMDPLGAEGLAVGILREATMTRSDLALAALMVERGDDPEASKILLDAHRSMVDELSGLAEGRDPQ